jgi:hypothetical protein
MPVLYSPLITSTASVATVAWPSMIPVRLTFVVSAVHEPGHFTIAAASALAPAVSRMDAASRQAVPGAVRSLVHSACSACLMRPSAAAGRRHGQGEHRPHAHHRETGPWGQRVAAVVGDAARGHL